RVVEIEDPVSDMGEFGWIGEGLRRVHTALCTPAERKQMRNSIRAASCPWRPAGRMIARSHGTLDPHHHHLRLPAEYALGPAEAFAWSSYDDGRDLCALWLWRPLRIALHGDPAFWPRAAHARAQPDLRR